MTIGETLREEIRKAANAVGAEGVPFTVEPAELVHGDYASNVALVAGKAMKKNPREVAELVKKELIAGKGGIIEDVSVAGPGFINIRLSTTVLDGTINAALQGENIGWNDALKGKKYIVEYTDPNPFKEFHIGHLMSNTIGEALSRLVEASGAETKRACYQGDVGLHVAKAIWGKIKNPSLEWGKAYAFGATEFEKEEKTKQEIVALNKVLYERSDNAVSALYDEGRKQSLRIFENMYSRLGTKFDHYFFESKTGTFGKELVEEHIGKVFEKSDGAVVYKGDESKGLHTRVFINKEGLPTYEAKELGLANIKHDTYPYDHSIVVTANEVNDYFRVLLDAMKKVFPELAAKTEHIGHGMMLLPSGKMSSRTGNVVTAESMIEEVKAKVLRKMADSPVPEKERDAVAEEIAVGAIKYSILRQAPGHDIVFDLEQATSFEGDSGPYLQYTHARIRALLRKGKDAGILPDASCVEHAALSRFLLRFADIVLRAQKERAPQHVATYLIELAQEFNSYYGNTHIVDEKAKAASSGRLSLSLAVGETLKSGLWMLGIRAPEAM